MRFRIDSRVAVGTLGALLFVVAGAEAQATRTWVSGVGDDANPCSRTAPCKTFAGAISKTAPIGEINVLDPGGFGGVTITKSITLDGSGGSIAGVLVSGTSGIIVNAGAGDVVTLRNLVIDGIGTGLIGIRILQAKAVYVENCQIFGFGASSPNGRGISDERSTPGGRLYVTDTVVKNNGHTGVVVLPAAGGGVTGVFERVRIEGNVAGGLAISGGARVTVQDSVASGNGAGGFYADGNGGPSELSLVNSVSNGNGTGVTSQVGAITRISRMTITNNGNGLTSPGGSLLSYGDNSIDGNTSNGSPTGTLGKQ